MKRNMRKLTALLLALLAALSLLGGCSDPEPAGNTDDTQPGNPAASNDWSKKIVIDVMTFDTGEADPNSQTDRVKAYIEEKFNCTFNVSTVTYGTTYHRNRRRRLS